MREKIDKISEMAAVMQRAIMADDDAVAREQEVIQQLKLENKTLRELLHVTVHSSRLCLNEQADTETQTAEGDSDQEGNPPDGVVTDSTSVSATTTNDTGSSSPSTNKTDKKSKDIQNDASKNSPKKNKDEEENKTGTVKRNDKKKDANKK